MKIVIGINSLTESQWPAYNSHLGLFYRLGREQGFEIELVNPSRYGIDKMRNMAATLTVQQKFDYLFFLDDDVVPTPDSLKQLIALDADIAAGAVIIRGYPFDYMTFKYVDKEKTRLIADSDYEDGETVVDRDAVGFSLCLIKRELLEQIPSPYFITGENHTEDVYFCLKARDYVPSCTIKVDTLLSPGHILWPEVLSRYNKKLYKEYYEKQFPQVLAVKQTTLDIVKVSPDTTYEDIMR